MAEILKDFVYLFVNHILCYIPSRRLRGRIYYLLSKGKISKDCSIAFGVKVLDIRNVTIGESSNINFGCILDGRGASITIGNNVDIAPQVNIWTMQHDVLSQSHNSQSSHVIIEDNVWIGNRAIILPGSILRKDSVIAAGVTFKGELNDSSIYVSIKGRSLDKKRKLDDDFVLREIRRFR